LCAAYWEVGHLPPSSPRNLLAKPDNRWAQGLDFDVVK
jgi:hypothetical protein